MRDGLIGKKIGMTQGYDAAGNSLPLTVLKAGPCTVIQRKTTKRDGYEAIQLALIEDRPARKPGKALQGHYVKSGAPVMKVLREVRCDGETPLKEGDQIFVDVFKAGEKVAVTGVSKGKGFAGVMKRHNFGGGAGAHGSMFHRAPGSIGASSYPSRVIKGLRMAGRMGGERVTVRNLVVFEADKDNNILVVKGAVPGPNGGYVLIRKI
ncbi:MAG: 50S ribosomal protein L3 [Acidobacteriota bacterium]|jgi:large subunit ribosomal protein L3|nr:50S ribosomal protein L3 [Acidobacteriota bacterium]OQB56032.1 MAG: 50S ribosomal protein L3 [Candidatus Aminicenantes bacterium ADurb.Bin147]HNQ79546.1 50S ribosomal protein L3 [Candidatus Aminicenantes bacterium]MDD8010106.1 50S ribosomal protein L3 [Acidobacteriota bacterium]MDD8029753.1 50S ribosomal protein L3 [Acidobacteriota bacterium]